MSNKKQKISKDNLDNNQSLEKSETDSTLKAMLECEIEIDNINHDEEKEQRAISKKFYERRKPIFNKINQLCSNTPDFWATVFAVTEDAPYEFDDEASKVLSYVSGVEVELGDYLRLIIHFNENPYLENTVLMKETKIGDEEGDSVTTTTPIRWKQDMSFLQGDINLPSTSKLRKRKHCREPSFFEWFADEDDEVTLRSVYEEWQNPVRLYFEGLACDDDDDLKVDDSEGSGNESDDSLHFCYYEENDD